MDTISMVTKLTPGIYAEIGQTRPFDLPQREALVTLTRTADVLRHALDRELAPYGVSPEQYNVLRILKGTGDAGHPTLEIARRMISRSPNVTRLIDKLVVGGLVTREQGSRDRRQAVVRLTAAGRQRLAALDRVVGAVLTRVDLTERESRSLVRILDRVRSRLARPTAAERSRDDRARRAGQAQGVRS